jgi:hypothetical protein
LPSERVNAEKTAAQVRKQLRTGPISQPLLLTLLMPARRRPRQRGKAAAGKVIETGVPS